MENVQKNELVDKIIKQYIQQHYNSVKLLELLA